MLCLISYYTILYMCNVASVVSNSYLLKKNLYMIYVVLQ